MTNPVFVIVGPTASGKSELALRIAEQINGCVVNADATQVYRDLRLISARPTETDLGRAPHLLYGMVDAWSQYTVQNWLDDVVPVLTEQQHPVLVGGTGLYIGALINGMHALPDVDPAIRKVVRALPIEEVRRQVKECRFTDPQRLCRALEVQLSTGKPLSWFYTQSKVRPINRNFKVIFLNPPRDILYERCCHRFHQMIANGGIEEVQSLMALNPTGGVLKAIGVPEIRSYLEGNMTQDEMVQAVILSTRHYAKRQVTWFRHQLNADVVLEHIPPHDLRALITE